METDWSPRRRLWSGKVKTKWTPPPGLFSRDAETIARVVLEGHDHELAPSVASINFYINRAGLNMTERDRVRLARALKIVQREGVSSQDKRRVTSRLHYAANPRGKVTRIDLLDAIQGLLSDPRTGLNRDHTILDLMEYLDDPQNPFSINPGEPVRADQLKIGESARSACGCLWERIDPQGRFSNGVTFEEAGVPHVRRYPWMRLEGKCDSAECSDAEMEVGGYGWSFSEYWR